MGSVIRHIKAQPAPSVVDQHRAQVQGSVAEGQAIADGIIKCVKGQGDTLKMFLERISGLSKEGRTAFRAQLDVTLKGIRENIKALGDTTEAKRAAGSARVRISDCRKFSTACDAGFNFSAHKGETYPALISLSRAFSESAAATGPSAKRGRKAKTWEEKFSHYVSDTLGLNAEQMAEARVILAKLAKTSS